MLVKYGMGWSLLGILCGWTTTTIMARDGGHSKRSVYDDGGAVLLLLFLWIVYCFFFDFFSSNNPLRVRGIYNFFLTLYMFKFLTIDFSLFPHGYCVFLETLYSIFFAVLLCRKWRATKQIRNVGLHSIMWKCSLNRRKNYINKNSYKIWVVGEECVESWEKFSLK